MTAFPLHSHTSRLAVGSFRFFWNGSCALDIYIIVVFSTYLLYTTFKICQDANCALFLFLNSQVRSDCCRWSWDELAEFVDGIGWYWWLNIIYKDFAKRQLLQTCPKFAMATNLRMQNLDSMLAWNMQFSLNFTGTAPGQWTNALFLQQLLMYALRLFQGCCPE